MTFIARRHHAQFDDSNYPAHITSMTEIDFKRAGNEVGFKEADFFYTNVGCVAKLRQQEWQKIPLVGRVFRGKHFSDNFGAVLPKPELNEVIARLTA